MKVGGAGACHSDLHVMEWPAGTLPYELPFTLGHENAGWIEALGAGVKGWEVGEAVAVYGPWGCGRCRPCRTGLETLCERAAQIGASGGGLGRDGGMAEYMLVPDPRLLVPLGDLDPRDAAPLSDAALTPYHAIKLALHQLVPGTSAVVIGVGGLGHMAVQILRALSPTRVIATDIDPGKLELARAVGAEHTVASGEHAAEEIRELTARARRNPGARLRRQQRHARAGRAGGRQGRRRDGDRRRRRHARVPLQHAAVRREPHPPVLGQRRSNSRRCSSWRARATSPRTPSTSRSSASPTPTSGCRTAPSRGAPSSRRTADQPCVQRRTVR